MSEEQKDQQNQDQALHKMLDHQRWLMNNGLINDMHKDQLYVFGAILHREIDAVELDIDVENKIVNYHLYIGDGLKKKIRKYNELALSKGIFGMWRFKKLLEKEGNLNFSTLINRFVKDYCGPKWGSRVEVVDVEDYIDGYQEQRSEQTDQQSNN